MGTETLKMMKDQLTSCVQGQLGDISRVDAQELGEAVDMIKDLAEAIYYCTITESMEKAEEKEMAPVNNITYYTTPMYNPNSYNYRNMERGNGYMYYPTGDNGETTYGGNMDSVGMLGNGGMTTYANSGGGGRGGNRGGGRGGSGGNSGGGSRNYTEMMPMMPEMMRDPREGRSPMRRRMYMEGKESHNDKNTQLRELEAYLQELSTDISEMIKDASQEERATLREKMTTLANKIA